MKNKYFILVILIILGLFYWFEYRPSQIKKECYQMTFEAMPRGFGLISPYGDDSPSQQKAAHEKTFEFNYKNCLSSKGL